MVQRKGMDRKNNWKGKGTCRILDVLSAIAVPTSGGNRKKRDSTQEEESLETTKTGPLDEGT